MKVPAFDLSRAVHRIEGRVLERWQRLLARTAFVGGGEVEEFERAFADYLQVGGCVGVANGTDALVLALRALDLKPRDEVIVPAFSFIATAAAVVLAGGRPVFADVEPETLNLDLEAVADRLGRSTVGLIGVHLYGRPFDLEAARTLCERRGLWLLEDAAQAHGARWAGRGVGGFGRLATWSFYPSKNLGCFGDGGAVTGNDTALLERVRRLANHGRAGQTHHLEVGTNSRLDALQAAVLNCRLPNLEADNERRRQVAARYRQELEGVGDLLFLRDPDQAESVYHQMTVRTPRRDELKSHLARLGIATTVHYPESLHRQPAFERFALAGDGLPVASAAAREVLCLPMFPEITDREVEEVCAGVRGFYGLAA
ncbi:MAG: DegT/DnrJ/EryC1/StrS family aminotransferase [Thermoanaerobaculia bacterium]